MQSLILLRGLPGSGKSTLANVLSENGRYPVFSVDDFFTDQHGNYQFKFEKNHVAYQQCEDNTRNALQTGVEKIFIANTFTMLWEMEPYFKMAAEFNCKFFVVTVEKYHNGHNIHNISEEQLQKMAEKYKVKLI
jgi:predicted kinase